MARRTSPTDSATASAIEQLVQSRTEGLYKLAAKVRELSSARDAIAAAQATERTLLAEAQELQQTLIASGWTLAELRSAGLFVGAPAVRRRRNASASVEAADVVNMPSPAAPADAVPGDGQGESVPAS